MSQTQANAMQAGAELLAEQAKEIGEKCRLMPEIASVTMLEQALAIAWAEVALFRGADDSSGRMELAIKTMATRIGEAVRYQHFMLKGARTLERERNTRTQ